MSGDDIALRLQRAAAFYTAKSKSDLNFQVPPLEYDAARKRYFFESAPTPLKRLLGSPLTRSGKNATGPNKERAVFSGWGRPRIYHSGESKINSSHKGLDFASFIGEKVYACADGVVQFVGYQGTAGGVNVPGIYANPTTRDLYNADNVVIATRASTGDAGIYVTVVHNGDFEGYRTEYMHLGKTYVKVGQHVEEGTLLGEVGNTAVYNSAIHLHFQIKFITGSAAAIVFPGTMVPNYWPGHLDSTSNQATAGLQDLGDRRPVGEGLALRNAAGTVQAIDRARYLQNQGGADLKRLQSSHRDLIVQNLNAQQSQVYAAVAQFNVQSPLVEAPMAFDFTTGLWTDGKAV